MTNPDEPASGRQDPRPPGTTTPPPPFGGGTLFPPLPRPEPPVNNGGALPGAGPPPPPPPPAPAPPSGRTIIVPPASPPSLSDPVAAAGLAELPPLDVPPPERPALPIRIGLWGSSRSGKSTYLAALPVAAMSGRTGTFTVDGTSDVAADYLQAAVQRLVVERRFPLPTRATRPISWRFQGRMPVDGLFARILAHRREPVEFVLEVFDASGQTMQGDALDQQVMEILASSQGLIYLLDPLFDPTTDVSFNHFFGAVNRMRTQLQLTGQLQPNGRLPHHLAVCVTKFDDELLFRRLVGTGLAVQDSDRERMPRVPDRRAREYFNWICDRVLGGGAQLVRNGIDANFAPERVRYFATSAIGFRLNRTGVFDFRDFRNVEMVGADSTLRDVARPINVMEPLIFLEQSIRHDRRR